MYVIHKILKKTILTQKLVGPSNWQNLQNLSDDASETDKSDSYQWLIVI